MSELIQPARSAYRYANRAVSTRYASHAVSEDMIELSGGFAYPKCLPDISRQAAVAAAEHRTETMQYSDVLGLTELRDLVVDYVTADGVHCNRDNVMIVSGAKQGLDLACRVFLEPGDRVIVTAPSYMTALDILRTHEVEFVTVAQDGEGLRTDDLEARLRELRDAGDALPKLLFDVPDFHNPTGITTSLARRRRLIALAEEFGFLIVEDDPYRRIRFEGAPVAPIKSLDTTGVVIGLGTSSKILAPGLRIGWVIASAEIIERIAAQKADGGTSPLNQRIFAEVLRGQSIPDHIGEIIRELRIHRDTMIAALAKDIPEIAVRSPEGGYFLWARLPDEIDASVLSGLALREGVKTYPGGLCFAGEPSQSALRLCFSYEEPDRLREGIARLAKAYRLIRGGLADAEQVRAAEASRDLATF
ncbi:MAG: aminotransferase [Rhizobiales bacterium]|mgnify:CR=1 FL=1|nr:aminotransferase [Hyphomicrobiales bacterium]MBA69145.1 aminotransferase [Hyphomicrobiales bacterium]|tara:strand:+ start:1023 stop:2276 length:1254 start_codon:yes stop_codon:yes gene_type:complete